MFGYSANSQTGRIATSEVDTIWIPRSPRQGTCGVILVHGHGQPMNFIDLAGQPSSVKLAAALASAGIPCIAGEFGGDIWGNATFQADIDVAFTVLKASFPTMRTDKFILLGISMGGCEALIYTQQNPTKVAAYVGIIPAVDLVSLYNDNIGGLNTEIATAWGVTAPAALPSMANTVANAGLATGVPMLIGYSSVDTTVKPVYVTNYVSAFRAAGGTVTANIIDTTHGHSDATVGEMPIPTVAQFLVANGA